MREKVSKEAEELKKSDEMKVNLTDDVLIQLYKSVALINEESCLSEIVNKIIIQLLDFDGFEIVVLSEDYSFGTPVELSRNDFSEKRNGVTCRINFIPPDSATETAFNLGPLFVNSWDLNAVTGNEPLLPPFFSALKNDGAIAALSAPLRLNNKILGSFILYSFTKIYHSKTIPVFGAVADAVAIGVNILLEKRRKIAEEAKKETLLSISRAIAAIHNKRELLRLIFQQLQPLFGYISTGLIIINYKEDTCTDWTVIMPELSPSGESNAIMDADLFTTPFLGGGIDYLTKEMEVTGMPIIFPISVDLIDKFPDFAEVLEIELAAGYKELWFASLKVGGRLYGTINFNSTQSGYFKRFDANFFQAIADMVAVAVANILANEELEERERLKNLQIEVGNALAEENWKARVLGLTGIFEVELPFKFWLINIMVKDNQVITYGISKMENGTYQLIEDNDIVSVLQVSGYHIENYMKSVREAIANYGDNFKKSIPLLKKEAVVSRIMAQFNLEQFLPFPIKLNKSNLVVFSFFNDGRIPFNQNHINVLESIQNYTGLCFERALAYDELQQSSFRILEENKYLQEEIKVQHNFDTIVGNSRILHQVFKTVTLVAGTDTTVLILGETGTGKELVARSIHSSSSRAKKSFIKVNCAALPAQLIESELFGHEKGSFTGAFERRVGKFELADGGSIFLDEIGELPIELQGKLLRVIQEKEFERIGGNKTIRSDVRIIAATNRVLEKEVEEGRFRSDLYYRLNVFPIYLPPLRERLDDIPLLATYFAHKFCKKMKRPFKGISEAMLDSFNKYNWPGNIRELENLMEQAVIVNQDSSELELARPLSLINHFVKEASYLAKLSGSKTQHSVTAKQEKENLEKEVIINALQKTKGKIRGENGASALLNILPTSLESKMKKYGISKYQFQRLGG